MNAIHSLAVVLLVGAPLAAALFYSVFPRAEARTVGKISVAAAALSLTSALWLTYGVFRSGPLDQIFAIVGDPQGFHFSVGAWIDRLSALSALLVTIIGLVVQRYSLRYLQGDARQSRFFAWLSFALAAVTLFVVSRNLLALTLSWFAVSLAVHKLLLHFPEREAAQKAAWRKFAISRLGDALLVTALVVTYQTFGTFEFAEIFAAVSSEATWSNITLFGIEGSPVALVGVLYVIGAMTKSAQFPFHIWLPDTMETPTPVSALMHAGIINAGGFLIVRLSPIVSHATVALDALFVVGAFTALFGGCIYLVQSDIKRSLAYSTIAQMGYMMMQCGLGAFAAAVMHLVMHGFYKANAFLSSAGNVTATPFLAAKTRGKVPSAPARLVAMALSLSFLVAVIALGNVAIESKHGAPVFCLFVWLAGTQALAPVCLGNVPWRSRILTGTLVVAGMGLYWTLLAGFNELLSPVMTAYAVEIPNAGIPSVWVWLVTALFAASFLLTEIARLRSSDAWARRLYVLFVNHFYVEYAWRRAVDLLIGGTRAMPLFETSAVPNRTSTERH